MRAAYLIAAILLPNPIHELLPQSTLIRELLPQKTGILLEEWTITSGRKLLN